MTRWINDALDLAYELNQIREVFGSECVNECERMLRQSQSDDWRETITAVAAKWQHHRYPTSLLSWAR